MYRQLRRLFLESRPAETTWGEAIRKNMSDKQPTTTDVAFHLPQSNAGTVGGAVYGQLGNHR